jgi:glucosamine--fructose-6-phosphate aminotransferase (isomerizing)
MAKYLGEGLEPRAAMMTMLRRVTGAYALAVMLQSDPDTIMAARSGPPLAIGYGKGEMFLGSDAIALSPFTNEITYLVDGDWAVLTRDGATILDFAGNEISRPRQISQTTAYVVDKGNHRHFMEKEIYEQPEVISHALGHYVDFASNTVSAERRCDRFQVGDRSRHLGLRHRLSRRPRRQILVRALCAPAGRDRCRLGIPLSRNAAAPTQAALFISQSGETADTLASLRYCKDNGLQIGAVVNVRESTIARESTRSSRSWPALRSASPRPRPSPASLPSWRRWQSAPARRGERSAPSRKRNWCAMAEMPRIMSRVLNAIQPQMETLSRELSKCRTCSISAAAPAIRWPGRRAEAEGNLLHPRRGLCCRRTQARPDRADRRDHAGGRDRAYDRLFDKTVSNMQEVAARGGNHLLITDAKGAEEATVDSMVTIVMPTWTSHHAADLCSCRCSCSPITRPW